MTGLQKTFPKLSTFVDPRQSGGFPYKNYGGKSCSAICSFFFCVPKRRNKKKAPQPVLALRASLTSRRERDAEKLGLRPQTVPASFPPPSARRGRTNGEERESPLARSRAPERLPKRGFALSERSEFAKPRQHRGVPHAGHKLRASRLRRDKRHGGPFFGSFLWASKEMNKLISRPSPRIPKKNLFPWPPHIPFALPKVSGIYRACPIIQLYLQDSTCQTLP